MQFRASRVNGTLLQHSRVGEAAPLKGPLGQVVGIEPAGAGCVGAREAGICDLPDVERGGSVDDPLVLRDALLHIEFRRQDQKQTTRKGFPFRRTMSAPMAVATRLFAPPDCACAGEEAAVR